MNSKDLQRAFRDANWASSAEVDAFVEIAYPAANPAEMQRLLQILNDRKLQTDAARHRSRCNAFKKLGSQVLDKMLFVPYVRSLKDSQPQIRAILAKLIPTVNNPQAHGEVCNLLRSTDANLRKIATNILKEIGGKNTVQLLARMIGEKNFPGRKEAMDVLVHAAGHYAITPLEPVVVGGGFPVDDRIYALQFLGDPKFMKRNTSGAIKSIRRVLNDGNETVRIAAINAFTNLCTEEEYFREVSKNLTANSLGLVKAAVTGLGRFHSRRVIVQLERKLRAGPNAIRIAVLNTLERIGRNEVLPPLVEALSFKQIAIRTRATDVLSKLSAARKIDVARTVIWLLRSRDVNVRRQAVEIARSVHDDNDELWPKLMVCLRDEDWWVRERVIDALVEMAGAKLTRHIVGYLKDGSDVVRRFAVGVLGKLKDPQALGTLVRVAQNDGDWWVREKAIEAIAAIGDPRAIPYIAQLMEKSEELRLVCLHAINELGIGEAADTVLACLKDGDDDIKFAALQCVQKLDDPAHQGEVEKLLDHGVSQIRDLGRELMQKWEVKIANKAVMDDDAISLLDRYLLHAQEQGGEDLILSGGKIPVMKQLGIVVPLSQKPLSDKLVRSLLIPNLNGAQLKDLDKNRDVDYSYEVKSRGLRFRVNVFKTLTGLSAVYREIRDFIPDLEALGLPPIVRSFGDLKNGLVLMGGPTGSGKSTTLAALIDYINATYDRHIISIEDPIEVVHLRKKGLVNQRELGTHTGDAQHALRATLRQDPDVILVGELRDYETISFAVSAAETGHLVFGTVHTVSAATTVDRLVNAFPAGQGEQVRAMLADSLGAVVCQHLLRKVEGSGRILAAEVMVNTEAISNLIRKNKAHQVPGVIGTGHGKGMVLMDQSLMDLYKKGNVFAEEVYMKAINKKDFEHIFDPTKVSVSQIARPKDAPVTARPGEGIAPWSMGGPPPADPRLATPTSSGQAQPELLLEDSAEALLEDSDDAIPAPAAPAEAEVTGELILETADVIPPEPAGETSPPSAPTMSVREEQPPITEPSPTNRQPVVGPKIKPGAAPAEERVRQDPDEIQARRTQQERD